MEFINKLIEKPTDRMLFVIIIAYLLYVSTRQHTRFSLIEDICIMYTVFRKLEG